MSRLVDGCCPSIFCVSPLVLSGSHGKPCCVLKCCYGLLLPCRPTTEVISWHSTWADPGPHSTTHSDLIRFCEMLSCFHHKNLARTRLKHQEEHQGAICNSCDSTDVLKDWRTEPTRVSQLFFSCLFLGADALKHANNVTQLWTDGRLIGRGPADSGRSCLQKVVKHIKSSSSPSLPGSCRLLGEGEELWGYSDYRRGNTERSHLYPLLLLVAWRVASEQTSQNLMGRYPMLVLTKVISPKRLKMSPF